MAVSMNWQSLLVGFLLFLILLVVVIVYVPAYLERLARVNLAQRKLYHSEQQVLDREERRLDRLITPYRRARSEAYQTAVSHVEEHLAQIRTEISGISQSVHSLQCPQLFDYLLPAQHFVIAPSHMNVILSDAKTLKGLKTQVDVTKSKLAKAQEAFDHLATLPSRLQGQREVLTQRLTTIESFVIRERNEGIEALDDFARDAAEVHRLLDGTGQLSGQELSLLETDAFAMALQQAAGILSEAEIRALELERERVAIDRRIRRAATDLDNTQALSKSGPDTDVLPQVRPIMRRAAALLNESAQIHRRRREFNAAGADVTTATQLIVFGRDLLAAHKQIQLLGDRDDGISLATPIAALRKEMSELLMRIESEGENAPSSLADAAVAGRAAQLRTRADTLVRQQDELISQLVRAATQTKERLERSWLEGQKILPLSPDDSLARRYMNLDAKFEAAQRKPAALEEYRRDVAGFEAIWEVWVTRVQDTRARIAQLRATMTQLIDQALALAEPWACLAEDVKFIQQRALDFETTRSKFNECSHRREAESIMDQLEAIEHDINNRLDQIKDRAARLAYLESDVNQLLELASGGNANGEHPTDSPDRPRWDRTVRLIDHHLRSAHAARHYEDACVALLRAAEAANKLAL